MEASDPKQTQKPIKAQSKTKQSSLSNDNTIFIRNLSFTTTEEQLKTLFINYVSKEEIAFCLVVKDKETQQNRGSAFLKLKSAKSFDKIMAMYHDYNNRLKHSSDMNPFELDGRNLKFFKAMTRDELKTPAEQNEESLSNRKKEYLYYGLSEESISSMTWYEDITETDKAKRGRLIDIKKANFQQNPNYHVSLTRLSLRNFDKTVKEDNIKEMITNVVEEDKDLRKKYKNIKMIKQVKLLKVKEGDNEKSKCVAFVECCSFDFAKTVIDRLSGYKMTPKKRKGLIIDFSLDDFRKRTSRLKKLERIREIRKEKKKEMFKEGKEKGEKAEKIEIGKVNDIDKLINLYQMTFSRGKRQRIKKKLRALGYTNSIAPLKDSHIKENEKPNKLKDEYVKVKISNSRTEMNKKMKEKRKEKKFKEEDKLLVKKRGRSIEHDDEVDKIMKKRKGFRVEKKNKKKVLLNNPNNADDDEDNDENMKEYYDKIEANLN